MPPRRHRALDGGRDRRSQSPTGLVVGLALGLLGARGLSSFIVGVSPYDPLTIAGDDVTLVVGHRCAASALPALRAARVDPLRALKME